MPVVHGQRVQHATWTNDDQEPLLGTVCLFPDAEPGTPTGEVRWDGYLATQQLELVIDQLMPA
jgi:hypothetical protein